MRKLGSESIASSRASLCHLHLAAEQSCLHLGRCGEVQSWADAGRMYRLAAACGVERSLPLLADTDHAAAALRTHHPVVHNHLAVRTHHPDVHNHLALHAGHTPVSQTLLAVHTLHAPHCPDQRALDDCTQIPAHRASLPAAAVRTLQAHKSTIKCK